MKYLVEFSYDTPHWEVIHMDATDVSDAEKQAEKYIEQHYPEASSFSIDNVSEVE